MNSFFAYMSRMKFIKRWSLMKSVTDENIAEHSAQVAQIAHALALIKNKKFGGTLDAERIDFEVKVGDTVILMSDGVSPSPEETPWLLDLLGEPLGDDLAAVADRVLTEARQKNSAADDMSVCLVRITPPKKRQI